jgi:hypothetical protein
MDWLWPPVDSPIVNVISTFKEFACNILLFGLLITQIITLFSYVLKLNARDFMILGLKPL